LQALPDVHIAAVREGRRDELRVDRTDVRVDAGAAHDWQRFAAIGLMPALLAAHVQSR
jgi:hypothetical protein